MTFSSVTVNGKLSLNTQRLHPALHFPPLFSMYMVLTGKIKAHLLL